jgi:Reverse transcriptase (RNA-dependent DNA polymerase)
VVRGYKKAVCRSSRGSRLLYERVELLASVTNVKPIAKVRVLSIPAIRDRVVQGALKLILEPIFEADFQPGSFGYRPKRTAHDAVDRVARAIVQQKTRIIDIDLRSYFDNVRHDRLSAKVARRVDDVDVLHLLKIMLKAMPFDPAMVASTCARRVGAAEPFAVEADNLPEGASDPGKKPNDGT